MTKGRVLGSDLVVIASNGGANRSPDWSLNLQQTPRAVVEIGTGGCVGSSSAGRCRGLADRLTVPELLPREVHVDAGREPVPHVCLDALAAAIHVGGDDLAAEEVLDDE